MSPYLPHRPEIMMQKATQNLKIYRKLELRRYRKLEKMK